MSVTSTVFYSEIQILATAIIVARPTIVCIEAIDRVGIQPIVEHDRGLCVTSNRLDFGLPELKENAFIKTIR